MISDVGVLLTRQNRKRECSTKLWQGKKTSRVAVKLNNDLFDKFAAGTKRVVKYLRQEILKIRVQGFCHASKRGRRRVALEFVE